MAYAIASIIFAICGIFIVGKPYSHGAAYWNRTMMLIVVFAIIYMILEYMGINIWSYF